MKMKYILLFIISSLMLLCGCSPKVTKDLDDYGSRKNEEWNTSCRLGIFPSKSIVEDAVNAEYFNKSTGTILFSGSDLLTMLMCAYTEEQYTTEIARLSECGAAYEESLLELPMYVWMANYHANTEYALLDEENGKIYYISFQYRTIAERELPTDWYLNDEMMYLAPPNADYAVLTQSCKHGSLQLR